MLAQRAVEHKRNEISTLLPWLSPTLVKDRIITADALHTQWAFCLRTCGTPLALAALNGTVLALMDWLQVSNVPSQMHRFCARPYEALALLLGALQR
ncbi:MAG TPA: hypothetical protein VFV38_02415 [Ktedonobacteraceae bacterium]|nr:hypothetical protein [Ktedonobacteraceae bacterium]